MKLNPETSVELSHVIESGETAIAALICGYRAATSSVASPPSEWPYIPMRSGSTFGCAWSHRMASAK